MISYPDPKLKNNWGLLSSTFHVEQPETLIEWKFKSMTYQWTNRQTWVGARDTCVSKNGENQKRLYLKIPVPGRKKCFPNYATAML